jgi:hypothetical protein
MLVPPIRDRDGFGIPNDAIRSSIGGKVGSTQRVNAAGPLNLREPRERPPRRGEMVAPTNGDG